MKKEHGFFIGWNAKLPKGLGPFLMALSLLLLGIFSGVAFSFVTTQNDPGDGAFRYDLRQQTITGILEAEPYPIIRILPSDEFPEGHTMMLAGQGKRGVIESAEGLNGKTVKASGILIKRGTLDMLQVGGKGLQAVENAGQKRAPPKTSSLGRWKLSGEICDGKCYTGAMRPGTGLAHKACANLCLFGGVPPVFVTKGEVMGSSFFMIGDRNGKPVTNRIKDLTALLIQVEGEIEKRGDLMVFKMDLDTVRRY